MRNIEKTFKFIFKNWVIILPAIIGCFIANAIVGILELLNIISLDKELEKFNQLMGQNVQSFDLLNYSSFIPLYLMTMVISIISIVLAFVYFPIIAGLTYKSIENNNIINIRDLFRESKSAFLENIKIYTKFFFANLLIIIISCIIMLVLIFIILFSSTNIFSKDLESGISLGFLLAFILIIVFFALAIVYIAFTGMWFQSIIVDKFKIFDALKMCFEILKRRFWYLIGLFILTTIVTFTINIFGNIFTSAFSVIPIIGWVVTGITAGFIVMFKFVFYMYIYYENRPIIELPEHKQITNNEGIEY